MTKCANKRMKYGIWSDFQELELLEDIQFDYLELKFRSIATMKKSEFKRLQDTLKSKSFKVLKMNCLFPKQYHFMDLGFKEKVYKFLQIGFMRAQELGTGYVVFGSPQTRYRPKKTTYEQYILVFEDILRFICDIADNYNVKIILEPICSKELNIINSVFEADRVVTQIDDHIGVLCDLFHMYHMNENFNILQEIDSLSHCHIVNPITRYCPLPEDGFDYAPFLTAVLKSHKIENITIESPIKECVGDIGRSIKYLKMLEEKITENILYKKEKK